MVAVHGTCDERFAPVQERFAASFDEGSERGAAVYVTLDGRPVVDLWAGERNDAGDPWERDTIVNVYSTTKTMSATVMLMLVDQGHVDIEAPVAEYWPEFKANGKGGVLVRHVLGHTAGVPGFDPAIATETLYDWDACCENLAAQAPWWEPGTQSGYHALTQGYIEGEIVRRVTGRTIGSYFAQEVAEPLGADFWIGLPASEDDRVADLVPPPETALDNVASDDAESIAVRTLTSVPITALEPRTREWRGAEIPAGGGTGNARSVGRVHSALACGGEVDGVRLLSQEGVERALVEQAHDVDLVLAVKMRMGTGFGLMNEEIPLSPNPRAFFWGGYGGSLALIDLDSRMTVTYVMNKMGSSLAGDLRGALLVFAAYQSLGDSANARG
jgi:CubicO group peptidase (beta-lactamase class C family)